MDGKSYESVTRVKIECLSDGKDFKHWKYRIRNVLKGYPDMLSILDGSQKAPIKPASTASETVKAEYGKKYKEFQTKDSLVLTLMTNNMTNEVLDQVMRFETAKEVWDELERLYCGCAEEKSYDLCLQFFSYQKDPEHDMKKHICALKNIWHELNNEIQAELPDILLICKILGTLPKDFFAFKSSWLLVNKNERTIENLTAQLSTFEKALKSNEEVSENNKEVLVVKTEKTNRKGATLFKCKYCGLVGHTVRKCRKWIADGRPPKDPSNSNTVKSAHLATVLVAEKTNGVLDKTNWYVDNGATSHVTNRGDYFESFEYFKTAHTVLGANGHGIEAIGVGTIRAEAEVDGLMIPIILKDVWYVPSIKKNLFSVLAVHDRNKDSVFESTPQKCTLKINGKVKVTGVRNMSGDLYRLNIKCQKPVMEINHTATPNLLQLYHERFGHQNKVHVKKVLEKELNIKVDVKKELCEGCIYEKSHRGKFGTRPKVTKPGELVSTDLCGPFPYSFSKYRYMCLFKDEYTKFRFVYFLRQKSEFYTILPIMLKEVKAAGYTVKELLSDNGGEFDNPKVRNILNREGVLQRLTMPYTPQQNPTERENRTIMEMTRSIMQAHDKIPDGFWAEIVQASVYILNRTGPSVNGVSPYEAWHKKKPRINHLRIIGSVCYPHIPKQKRKKLEKKAQKGILIGYDGDEGYRIWDSKAHRLIRTKDVTFDEMPLLSGSNNEMPLLSESNDEAEEPESFFNFGLRDYESRDDGEPSKSCSNDKVTDACPKSQRFMDDDLDRQSIGANVQDVVPDGIDNNGLELSEEPESDKENIEETDRIELELSPDEIEDESRMTLRNRNQIKPPSRYRDYVCTCMQSETITTEPKTYKEAMTSTEREKWQEAIEREINSLKSQIADMLTKPLYGPRIKELKTLAGVSKKRGGC